MSKTEFKVGDVVRLKKQQDSSFIDQLKELARKMKGWSEVTRSESGPGIAKKIPLCNRRFLSQTTSWGPYDDWDNLPDA